MKSFDLDKFKSRQGETKIKHIVEDGQTYVIRNGKRFAIETLNPDSILRTKRKEFKLKFVPVPLHWVQALRRSNGGVYELALAIQAEKFQRDRIGGEIVLSAKMTSMSRATRHRAAKELERLGLIKLDGEGHQALKVTVV